MDVFKKNKAAFRNALFSNYPVGKIFGLILAAMILHAQPLCGELPTIEDGDFCFVNHTGHTWKFSRGGFYILRDTLFEPKLRSTSTIQFQVGETEPEEIKIEEQRIEDWRTEKKERDQGIDNRFLADIKPNCTTVIRQPTFVHWRQANAYFSLSTVIHGFLRPFTIVRASIDLEWIAREIKTPIQSAEKHPLKEVLMADVVPYQDRIITATFNSYFGDKKYDFPPLDSCSTSCGRRPGYKRDVDSYYRYKDGVVIKTEGQKNVWHIRDELECVNCVIL